MQINSVSSNSSVNSKALVGIKMAGRFNPGQSESSYKLLQTFKNGSWGMQTLCEKYNVKALFSTYWYDSHPLYTPEIQSGSYRASYAQIDLFVKEPCEDKGFWAKIKNSFKPWRKISYGEYSDLNAHNPLSNAEEKLAFVIKHLEYAALVGHILSGDKEVVTDSAREMRKYYFY